MKAKLLIKTIKEYGLPWAFWRGLYAVALKTGYFEWGMNTAKDPLEILVQKMGGPQEGAEAWLANVWQENAGPCFHPAEEAAVKLSESQQRNLMRRADDVLEGKFDLFSTTQVREFPPNWFQAESGFPDWPRYHSWTKVSDLGSGNGDIKHLWEMSRFTSAYVLVQAYHCSGDEKYAQGFWQLCESWWTANPLGIGPHWRCGQEMSFRVLAWSYGLFALKNAQASNADRVGQMVANLWHHGRHIEKVNWYATRCVRNNHAISEAVALRTLGLQLPFLPAAARWRQKGWQSLVEEVSWQVYDDGTYVQQSNNYSRLVVQLLSWALAIEDASHTPTKQLAPLQTKARSLVDQLSCQLSGLAGEVPNFGANDGTLLFPWSENPYADFRPALQALDLRLGGQGLPDSNEFAEEAFWFGAVRLTSDHQSAPSKITGPSYNNFPDGGLTVARNENSMVLFRCGPNRNRPIQSDMLHVDYWYRGMNVLLDAGTYSYNVEPKIRAYFAGTRSHNTVMVDGRDQMLRGSRFLWHDWVQGELEESTIAGSEVRLIGRQAGYQPMVHRRTLRFKADCLLILDELDGGDEESELRLHWLMPDLPQQEFGEGLAIEMSSGEKIALKIWSDDILQRNTVRGDKSQPAGVHSPQYGIMDNACSIIAVARAKTTRFLTLVGPEHILSQELESLFESDPTVSSICEAWEKWQPQKSEDGSH